MEINGKEYHLLEVAFRRKKKNPVYAWVETGKRRYANRCNYPCYSTGIACGMNAVDGYRCKYHGGSFGGAPKGNKNRLTDGVYTKERKQHRKRIMQFIKMCDEFILDTV